MSEHPLSGAAIDQQRLQEAAQAWFAGPLGRLLLESQQALLAEQLDGHFGSFLLHYSCVGAPPPLRHITHAVRLGPALPGVEMVCAEDAWPVLEHGADLVLLQHALDFAVSPHRLLREAARCVRPGGHLLIAGIHPWSLWGLRHWLATDALAQARCIAPARIADWLHLLGFALEKRRFGCYRPPLASAAWQQRLEGWERLAGRWQGVGGGVYLLVARKMVVGLRPLRQERREPMGKLLPLPMAKVNRRNSEP